MQLYSFLSRRTESKFNSTIHKRLNQSKLNRYPISLSRITRILTKDRLFAADEKQQEQPGFSRVINALGKLFKLTESKKPADRPDKFTYRIVVVVGTVTNDNRLLKVPEGLRVCALKFTKAARARIMQAKGECLTFD